MNTIGLVLGMPGKGGDNPVVNRVETPLPILGKRPLMPNFVEPDENGNYRIDDMILTEEQFKLNYVTEEEKKAFLDRQGIPGSEFRWTNNELPYQFSSEINPSNRDIVKNAIVEFNSKLAGCFTIR